MTRKSRRARLSIDAQIILALMDRQPLTWDELKKLGISRAGLYRIIPLLLEKGILKQTSRETLSRGEFALFNYNRSED
ncbi:MAG: hypothetical protein ACE5NN_07230 [Candidatus Bathyarchaeia archaeon]